MIDLIWLYSGTPGSGKSLHAASYLYWWLRSGKPAICNFDINLFAVSRHTEQLRFLSLSNNQLTPDLLRKIAFNYFDLRELPVREDSILLVIDEAQLMFNAREWQTSGRSDWLSFFSQHRKYGYKIILLAQFDRMIDRQIRSLIEYEFIHRKVSNMGWRGFFLSALMGSRVHVAVKVWYAMKEKVGSEFFRARKKYYRLYDTYMSFT